MEENFTNAPAPVTPSPKLSRQRQWQEKRKAAGLCACCGKEPLITHNYGEKCAQRIREKARQRTGAKARYLGSSSYNAGSASKDGCGIGNLLPAA